MCLPKCAGPINTKLNLCAAIKSTFNDECIDNIRFFRMKPINIKVVFYTENTFQRSEIIDFEIFLCVQSRRINICLDI